MQVCEYENLSAGGGGLGIASFAASVAVDHAGVTSVSDLGFHRKTWPMLQPSILAASRARNRVSPIPQPTDDSQTTISLSLRS
jgi:hypothetical protein